MNIREELITNLDHYKHLLSSEILQRAELLKHEDPCFHQDIEEQFLKKAIWTIIKDMGSRFGVSIDDAIIAMEDVNLTEILC